MRKARLTSEITTLPETAAQRLDFALAAPFPTITDEVKG